jgi:hypothetical protein
MVKTKCHDCFCGFIMIFQVANRGNPEKGREAAAPSNIKEIQEIQRGQEAPHDGDAINPKDA